MFYRGVVADVLYPQPHERAQTHTRRRKNPGACFQEVQDKAGDYRRFRLLVEESASIGAFAIGHNTIVMTTKALRDLDEKEIKGVMAHELGHIRTFDTIASSAITGSQVITLQLKRVIAKIFGVIHGIASFFFKLNRLNTMAIFPLAAFPLAGTDEYRFMIVLGFIFRSFVFVYVWLRVGVLFSFLYKINSRHTEYRQDAFAQSLGYGMALKSAFLKIMGEGPQVVSAWVTIMRGTHPVTHNRIRRLEQLEGLRAKDGSILCSASGREAY